MHADPHTQRHRPADSRDSALHLGCGHERIHSRRERSRERVTGTREHNAAARRDAVVQQLIVDTQNVVHSGAITLPETGRAFKIGEEERHHPARSLNHRSIMPVSVKARCAPRGSSCMQGRTRRKWHEEPSLPLPARRARPAMNSTPVAPLRPSSGCDPGRLQPTLDGARGRRIGPWFSRRERSDCAAEPPDRHGDVSFHRC